MPRLDVSPDPVMLEAALQAAAKAAGVELNVEDGAIVVTPLIVRYRCCRVVQVYWRNGQPLAVAGGISRQQNPDSFRKAVGVQLATGLLFMVGWFIDHYWHIF